MVNKNAQEWLEQNHIRETIKELYISRKSLEGHLDLSDFVNLEKLYCSENSLTSLDLSNCSKLKVVNCSSNQLTSLDLGSCSNLTEICCNFNKLTKLILPRNLTSLKNLELEGNNFNQNLSFLKGAINLESLTLVSNDFEGSLEYLKEMGKLWELNINDTHIDSGLEYLPESVKKFHCLAKKRLKARCQTIFNLFADEQGEVETRDYGWIKGFPQKLQAYKQKLQEQSQQTTQIRQAELPPKS